MKSLMIFAQLDILSKGNHQENSCGSPFTPYYLSIPRRHISKPANPEIHSGRVKMELYQSRQHWIDKNKKEKK